MEEAKWYIYRHRRLDTNEIFYIGLGSSKYYARAVTKYSRNILWTNIISKTEYSIEILVEKLTKEDAKELEMFLIELYGRRDLGTGCLANFTNGGDGISGLSEEGRQRKIDKMSGENNHNFGKKGEESIHYGVKRSKETGDRISKANIGREGIKGELNHMFGKCGEDNPLYKIPRPQEVRDKIRNSKVGVPNKAADTLRSEAHRKRVSERSKGNKSRSRWVLDLEMGVYYTSAREASKYKNINYSTLIDYLKGKYPNKTSLIYV